MVRCVMLLLVGLLAAVIGGNDGASVMTATDTQREGIEVALDWLSLRPLDLGNRLVGDAAYARGGRAVAVSVGEAEQRDVDSGAAQGELFLDAPPTWPTYVLLPRDEFRRGFLDAGGSSDFARYFVRVVLPCESAGQPPGGFIDWTPGNQNYYTASQIHPGNLPRIERDSGRSDFAFEEPYDVGVMSATWLAAIGEASIASTGGWECAAVWGGAPG